MTARHPVVALSHLDEAKYKQAISTLTLACDVIRCLKIGVKGVWKPCQTGVLMSTDVVMKLHRVLMDERGYTFVLTGRLVQDCLENLFSVVRMMSPVPSAYDLKNALRIVVGKPIPQGAEDIWIRNR